MNGTRADSGGPAGRLRCTLNAAPSLVAIAFVHLYRKTLGVVVPAGTCKYHPSCSQYALDALRRYGLVRGTVLAGWRLLRCNPWSHGGVDRVEDQRLWAS